jgi:adenylate cyclase class IV
MREVELKSVTDAPDAVVAALIRSGAEPAFAGRLSDRRFDTADRSLTARDLVLRLRTYANDGGSRSSLEFKGRTHYAEGYKVREELGTDVQDAGAMLSMLERLGYVPIGEIDRDISQFVCMGATVRVERYPRMDALVEIEGTPEAIEAAIACTGMPREGFTSQRLADFVRDFESRTGQRAAVCDREVGGDYRYGGPDA